MTVLWKEPPPIARAGTMGYFDELASELRSRPGAWALIASRASITSARSARTHLRKTYMDFEFTQRGLDIYARYTNGGTA